MNEETKDLAIEEQVVQEEHTSEPANDEEEQLPVEAQQSLAPETGPEKIEQPEPKESFKELREKKSQIEKERDEAYYYINHVLRQQNQQPPQAKEKEEDEFDINNVPDDDLVQGNQFKKYSNSVKKNIQQIKKQNDEFIAEYRLNKKFTDFNDVFTDENVAMLSKKKPWLAKRLAQEPDIYEKAKEVYLAIKDFGIYSSDEDNSLSEKISENKKKPKDATSAPADAGSNALDFAHGFAHDYSKKDKARIRSLVESRIKAGNKSRK